MSNTTAALRRELAKAMATAEAAALPLQRLAHAREAFDRAQVALGDFDVLEAASWQAWAATGCGVQPSPNAAGRAQMVAAVDAARAAMNGAQSIAGPFASAMNKANDHVAVIAAQLRQATLGIIYEAVEVKVSEYIESAQNTARLYAELLGFDQYIYGNFKDCHINGRVAGLVHNRDAATDVLIIPGFDLKSLDHRNRFTVKTNPEDIERGRQLAAKATLED